MQNTVEIGNRKSHASSVVRHPLAKRRSKMRSTHPLASSFLWRGHEARADELLQKLCKKSNTWLQKLCKKSNTSVVLRNGCHQEPNISYETMLHLTITASMYTLQYASGNCLVCSIFTTQVPSQIGKSAWYLSIDESCT